MLAFYLFNFFIGAAEEETVAMAHSDIPARPIIPASLHPYNPRIDQHRLFLDVDRRIEDPAAFLGLKDFGSVMINFAHVLDDDYSIHITTLISALENLHGIRFAHNALKDVSGAALIASLRQLTHLSQLILYGNRLGDACIASLVRALPMSLSKLDLGGNDMAFTSAQALAGEIPRLINLKELNVGDNPHIGSYGINILLTSLPATMVSLKLFRNHMGRLGGHILSVRLEHLPHLAVLDIGGNQLGDDDTVAEFASGLRYCQKLIALRLHSNNIRGNALEKLADNLRYLTCLEELDLASNTISPADAGYLAQRLGIRLKTLNLNGNRISDIGAYALQLELARLVHLERIFLERNKISPPVIQGLLAAAVDRRIFTDNQDDAMEDLDYDDTHPDPSKD